MKSEEHMTSPLLEVAGSQYYVILYPNGKKQDVTPVSHSFSIHSIIICKTTSHLQSKIFHFTHHFFNNNCTYSITHSNELHFNYFQNNFTNSKFVQSKLMMCTFRRILIQMLDIYQCGVTEHLHKTDLCRMHLTEYSHLHSFIQNTKQDPSLAKPRCTTLQEEATINSSHTKNSKIFWEKMILSNSDSMLKYEYLSAPKSKRYLHHLQSYFLVLSRGMSVDALRCTYRV
jgi:hypothetical protein